MIQGPLSPPSDAQPRVLSVGGSDPTGASGIQADLKTLTALGVQAAAAVTAVTVQTSAGVQDVVHMSASVLAAQLDAAWQDFQPQVVKTGMLGSVDAVHALADRLRAWGSSVRLIIDPVLAASSGRRLLDPDARGALVERLVPMCALITPNLPEAGMLTGVPMTTEGDRNRAVDILLALGAPAVLLKGGHQVDFEPELEQVTDLLRTADGDLWSYGQARLPGSYRGTGCTLASAIAAFVAEGRTLRDSVEAARDYLRGAMFHAPPASARNMPRQLHHAWCVGTAEGDERPSGAQ